MKRLIPALCAMLLATAAPAQEEMEEEPALLDMRAAETVTLDEFLWLNRLIVVFANTPRDPAFIRQIELLAERPEELVNRDVIVITDTDPSAETEIRRALRPRGFGFVFVDKDGVVKLRKPAPWHVREIIRSIDKTELRQQEIRDAQGNGS